MYKRILSLSATLAFMAILSACSSTPYATQEKNLLRKQFNKPEESKVGLYIYRTSIFFGDGATKEIKLDNQFIGQIKPGTFLFEEVQSGNHTLATKSSIGFNEITINFQGGQNYFFKQSFTPGAPFMGPATNFNQVDEATGKEQIGKSRLVEQPSKF